MTYNRNKAWINKVLTFMYLFIYTYLEIVFTSTSKYILRQSQQGLWTVYRQREVTHRAVEAFRMEVLAHGLDPFVARFDGEAAPRAHCLEHGVPIYGQKHLHGWKCEKLCLKIILSYLILADKM